MNQFLKDFSEVQLTAPDPKTDFFRMVNAMTRENGYEGSRAAFPEQILKNLNKGSNTYEGFEEKNKQTTKMYDDLGFSKVACIS